MIIEFEGNLPIIDETVFVAEGTQIIGKVEIKKDAAVWFNAVIRSDEASITIGENTNIQDGCTLHDDTGYDLVVGRDVTVGHNVILHGCKIANNVLVGMGSTILTGAEISENTIIGANSLVTQGKKFPPGVLITGSPAKVMRELKAEEIENIKISVAGYVNKKNIYMK